MLFDNAYCDCADLISLFHVVFVASNLLGLLLVLIGGVAGWKWVRNPWFRGIHLGMAAIVAFEAAIAYECPLTTWEYDLRVLGGQLAPDFREGWTDIEEMSFVGRQLHALVPSSDFGLMMMCIFIGFGVLVLGSLICIPPRNACAVVALNVCCLAMLYPFWLYAGRPDHWWASEWPLGRLVALWQALPFAVGAGLAIILRQRGLASFLLCSVLMIQSVVGFTWLAGIRPATGHPSLAMFELALPIVQLLVLTATFLVARRIRPQPAPTPEPAVIGES